jgi:hypothetical protein
MLTYGTKVSHDSDGPQDQPGRQHGEHSEDKQNTPKVSQWGSSCRWKSELIPIYVQVVDQQPDGTHSNPPEPETGSEDDDEHGEHQEDKQNTPPKVSQQGSSCRWKSELISI